jgi:type II secretory pathway pseudopilin PulG
VHNFPLPRLFKLESRRRFNAGRGGPTSAFQRLQKFPLTSLRAVRPYRQEADLRPLASAFTLIEMIVVILIIMTLAAGLLTATSGMFDRARKVQAKNDLTQLVTAINAFYTEYGQYPVAAQSGDDSTDYVGADDPNGAAVIDTLRVPTPSTLNPRGIVFLNVLTAKSSTTPISGVGTTTHAWYDPWGSAYRFKIDNNYNSTLTNPYTANAGTTSLTIGCIAWSLGKDKAGGIGDKDATTAKDDVLSWQ